MQSLIKCPSCGSTAVEPAPVKPYVEKGGIGRVNLSGKPLPPKFGVASRLRCKDCGFEADEGAFSE